MFQRAGGLIAAGVVAFCIGGCVAPPDAGPSYPSSNTSTSNLPNNSSQGRSTFLYTDDPTNSNISGNFKGWGNKKVYELDNGQVWRQKDYQYRYHFAFHPAVTVYKGTYDWFMVVDGDDGDAVAVERLR